MLETEWEKLENRQGDYISIGISVDGTPITAFSVPWESTTNAFNMKTPDVFISPEDLSDKKIMDKLSSFKVLGCYIWAPLEDYTFLSSFKDIWDLSIKNGENIKNLDFLLELHECRMFYVENMKVHNIDVILKLKEENASIFGSDLRCVGLYNCEVEDLSAFTTKKHKFNEFLVWSKKEKSERKKWEVVSAFKRKCYEI